MKHLTTLIVTSILLMSPLAAKAATVTLNPTADGYVTLSDADTQHGSDDTIYLLFGSVLNRARAYLRFDTSAIPASSTIESAYLDLLTTSASGAGTVQVGLYYATQNWTEESLTWNAQPTIGDLVGTLLYGRYADSARWDIGSMVQTWVNGANPNYGMLLRGQEQGDAYTRALSSREATRKPQLIVSYTPPPAPPPAPPPPPAPAPTSTPPTTPPAGTDKPSLDIDCAPGVKVGERFRSATLAAVYYCSQLRTRHAFPNDKVYLSWYTNFDGIVQVGDEVVRSIPIGAPVRPRPGARLVQFVTLAADGRSFVVTDPRVYATDTNGRLRWITTAQVAATLFGAQWEQLIVPHFETDFTRFTPGADINAATDYTLNAAATAEWRIDVDLFQG